MGIFDHILSSRVNKLYIECLENFYPNNEFNANNKIYEWQGWSYNNTCNHINPSEGEGCLIFLSKEEINEMEILGLYNLLKYKAKMYKGLDITFTITKGYYDVKLDLLNDNKIGLYVARVSKGCYTEEILELLKCSKNIICVHYVANARYNKSTWWRFRNKKIHKVINLVIDDY